MKSNFINQVLSGDEFIDRIHDYVDRWHDGPGKVPIHEFLGLSFEEYSWWVSDEKALPRILIMRQHDVDVSGDTWGELHQLAARAQQPQDRQRLKEWLCEKGLI